MSEYQYYEFQAIDCPLDEAEIEELRSLSTRARITATSFTNHYDWGDFHGDPRTLVEHYFDLHLYLANWGTRQLMIRLPKRLVDRSSLDPLPQDSHLAEVIDAGNNLILNVWDDNEERHNEEWDDGSGWLGVLAPLRADLLSGDFRVLYLIWLASVDIGHVSDDELGPFPGIGPLTGALEAFANFFRIDLDLARAAATSPAQEATSELTSKAVHAAIASIPEDEKTKVLHRLFEGDPHVAHEMRNRVRKAISPARDATQLSLRTVSNLKSFAVRIREELNAKEAERREAERIRQEEFERRLQRARIDALRKRGEAVWDEIESEIERRNASGYERAMELLIDLKALSKENGTLASFVGRLNALRSRHTKKKRFIDRLAGLYKTG